MSKINTLLFTIFTVSWAAVAYTLYMEHANNVLSLLFLTMTSWACGNTFNDFMDETFGTYKTPKGIKGRWRL